MRIGFTGTRVGMTDAQLRSVGVLMLRLTAHKSGPHVLHHGMCVGADHQTHDMWLKLAEAQASASFTTHGHPGLNQAHRPEGRARVVCDRVESARLYLARNHRIVASVEALIAAPGTAAETLRAGTWATVRAARRRGLWTLVVDPTGVVREERTTLPEQLGLFGN